MFNWILIYLQLDGCKAIQVKFSPITMFCILIRMNTRHLQKQWASILTCNKFYLLDIFAIKMKIGYNDYYFLFLIGLIDLVYIK